mgnify:CR=1 FL=1
MLQRSKEGGLLSFAHLQKLLGLSGVGVAVPEPLSVLLQRTDFLAVVVRHRVAETLGRSVYPVVDDVL